MSIVKSDLIEAISPLQLCAGLEAGCEAAVHFISQSYVTQIHPKVPCL